MPDPSRKKLSVGRAVALAAALVVPLAVPGFAAEPLALETKREPLNPEDQAQLRVGDLIYRGGLSITSPNARFGGLSGLVVRPDGSGFTAVTDQGDWVTAAMRYDTRGWLVDLESGRIGHLRGLDGKRLKGKLAQDAEALTRLSDGSHVVAFEHEHRVWRYGPSDPPFGRRPVALPMPPGLAGLPQNHGLEAMTGLGDGAMLALTQDRDGAGRFPAYLWRGGRWQLLSYPAAGGFEPSGATRLPSGDLVVLERGYSFLGGLFVRLMQIDQTQLGRPVRLQPRKLGELKAPLALDNFEAVDSRRGPSGETLLYILSDDNFSPWQRTLLLQFALSD